MIDGSIKEVYQSTEMLADRVKLFTLKFVESVDLDHEFQQDNERIEAENELKYILDHRLLVMKCEENLIYDEEEHKKRKANDEHNQNIVSISIEKIGELFDHQDSFITATNVKGNQTLLDSHYRAFKIVKDTQSYRKFLAKFEEADVQTLIFKEGASAYVVMQYTFDRKTRFVS